MVNLNTSEIGFLASLLWCVFMCVGVMVQDFSAEFSDLDGVVRQRRHEMLESSSSGSQTPEYEKMAGE